MSFNSPFFDFFDNINSEVDNFNRLLDNAGFRDYSQKRQRLIGGNQDNNNKKVAIRPTNNLLSDTSFGDLDDWFDNDLSLFPTNFAAYDKELAVPVDILDHEKNYELKITVPGVKSKKDIDLEYHKNDNQIIVSGQIPKISPESKKAKVKVNERASGKFKRIITLPGTPGIDADHIKADYTSGVLTLTVPKLKSNKDEKEHVQKIAISSEDSWNDE
ncbi:chaperone protein HSP26 NDAI_0A05590 [Naumovozyma dairenensis CBS 421]|uniref:SHSP domain-containing protein n=1 Tax=Naumovozyma dairenensis (strain ATCC 10597 / BCRC 20456 / CBS 421 / NBRC 0211 / NRRL Y-12639) TaxID=1071378 RepID=G0W4H6_NAUDC|nr:hypothetical protein NDAI_0A05590 [Naumovozyma dairenensis CBS 421]CCD22714.1 hypothetical protein NDAI_0A05590 [Naumovozyma dairenensis CBS 421]